MSSHVALVCFAGRSGGRVVVPAAWRSATLANLHRAHQGQINMMARAQESVWWPGLSKNISATQAACDKCMLEAPSQPRDSPEPIQEPDYPSETLHRLHRGQGSTISGDGGQVLQLAPGVQGHKSVCGGVGQDLEVGLHLLSCRRVHLRRGNRLCWPYL